MRLDKYLKVSRIVKRRTVANEICDAGRVSVNGKTVKASYSVMVGDIIEVTMGTRTSRAKVLSVEEKTGKDTAREMYEVVE
jgi:Ribosome-associated heat shock protein implicated in the recycling of the 50S subunit (S4 paralog)